MITGALFVGAITVQAMKKVGSHQKNIFLDVPRRLDPPESIIGKWVMKHLRYPNHSGQWITFNYPGGRMVYEFLPGLQQIRTFGTQVFNDEIYRYDPQTGLLMQVVHDDEHPGEMITIFNYLHRISPTETDLYFFDKIPEYDDDFLDIPAIQRMIIY